MRRILDTGVEGLNTTMNRHRTDGYIIDKESWVQGINPITGLSYLHYTEIPIRKRHESKQRRIEQGRKGESTTTCTGNRYSGGRMKDGNA